MIDFTEKKKGLIQDLNAQKVKIDSIEDQLESEKVLLARLEGAIMLCDQLANEQVSPATPAQPIAES